LRCFLFNIVLDARIARGDHGVAIDGDVVDCGVPTGPLWGRGRSATRGEALEVEQAALRPWAGLCEGLEFAGLRQARRRLIERPDGLRVEQTGEGDWMLQFSLPPGSYATTMLESVLNLIDDSAARGAI
jgi:tRNA pseudouridine13 synthase